MKIKTKVYNYFPSVDAAFKQFYRLNQSWFKYRNRLSEKQLKKLFDLTLSVGDLAFEINKNFYSMKEERKT